MTRNQPYSVFSHPYCPGGTGKWLAPLSSVKSQLNAKNGQQMESREGV